MIRTYIKQHELGLVFRRGDLAKVLAPGSHFVPGLFLPGSQLQVVNTLVTRFVHSLLDVLVAHPVLREHLTIVDNPEGQRALVWRDGCLFDFVGTGRFAYWKTPHALKVETFDVRDVEFRHEQRDAVLSMDAARTHLKAIDVDPHEALIVRRGGELLGVYGAGRHVFWAHGQLIGWKAVELREQVADVAGQEIMTADKVTLRLNLVVSWRITDPVGATTVVDNAGIAVYREAQLALRAAVGGRTLDQLLTDKDQVATEIRTAIARRAEHFGVAIASVGIRDVVLPGEMKTILNQVIEAQKRAEANLILRREETAAARSQANTARLLAENPVLLRLKELEAVEAIVRGTRATFVFGPGELAPQVKSLVAAKEDE